MGCEYTWDPDPIYGNGTHIRLRLPGLGHKRAAGLGLLQTLPILSIRLTSKTNHSSDRAVIA